MMWVKALLRKVLPRRYVCAACRYWDYHGGQRAAREDEVVARFSLFRFRDDGQLTVSGKKPHEDLAEGEGTGEEFGYTVDELGLCKRELDHFYASAVSTCEHFQRGRYVAR